MKKFKEKLANLSIKYHIIITMVIFFAVAVLLVCLVFNRSSDFVYRAIKVKSTKNTANYIASKMPEIVYDENNHNSELFTVMEDLTLENDVCAMISNVSTGSKSVISYKYAPVTNLSSFSLQTLYNMAITNGGKITLYADAIGNLNIFDFSKEFSRNRVSNVIVVEATTDSVGNNIAVIVSSEIRPRDVTNNIFWNQAWIIIIVFLVCSVFVSLVLTKIIAKPIKNLNDKALTLAKGNYDAEFNGKGYKEISELSDTLNYAASELSKVDNLKNDLIANVSHDLRTPLTMISGYGEIIRDIPGENNSENVQVIINEANRLSSMVNNLLDLSKLQSGNLKMEKEELNITELLNNIVNDYCKMMNEFEFVLETGDKEIYIMADKVRISQVIQNLLNNAVNYSKDNKQIIIRSTIVDKQVRVDIIDHGLGVSKEDLPYIWDRYYKIDKEHQRAISGCGLGLSIVKEILKEHSASYGVDSQIDKGSDFYFQIDYLKIT